MSASERDLTRLEELLADRALAGLSPAEELELERLLAAVPAPEREALLESWDGSAASLDLALGARGAAQEPMPAGLREELRRSGEAWLASRPAGAAAPSSSLRAVPSARAPRLLPWALAAAASVLAILGWWSRAERAVEPEAARGELVAKAGTASHDMQATDRAPGAAGDVVWNQADQRGFLRITGLAKNDPRVVQYQIWIFDEEQQHPIDGGVFDAESGEIVIPIHPKLPVGKPKLFAVTEEKPGGVVVSDQRRIVLVMKT